MRYPNKLAVWYVQAERGNAWFTLVSGCTWSEACDAAIEYMAAPDGGRARLHKIR